MKTIQPLQPTNVVKPMDALRALVEKEPVGVSFTACAQHGETEWEGHIACGACGNLYETRAPAQFDRLAPRKCQCDHRLLPQGKLTFSAKICCSDCWKGAMARWLAAKKVS